MKIINTTDYFHLPAEELAKDGGDGYTKEDNMILDQTEEHLPFCFQKSDALRKANYYKKVGYREVCVLKCITNQYAVLARAFDPRYRRK